MRFTISDIETKLETFFEDKLQSFFNTSPLILLTNVLIKEFENSIRIKDGKRIAPNVFNIFIQKKDHFKEDELIEWKIFAHQLIIELAQNNSYILSGPIYLETFFDETIKNKYLVSAAQTTPTSGKTINIITKTASLSDDGKFPSAYMILWNEKIYEITKSVTNIGRRDENDLIIDNLRVSRLHAQIRKIKGGFMLFDIDSTSGTKVNGHLIKQQRLINGDVIEIADVPIIFSCDGNFGDKYPQSAKTMKLKTKTSGKI